jgi:hypothetical protein
VELTDKTQKIVMIRERCNEIMTLYLVELSELPEVKIQKGEISEYGWYTIQEIQALETTIPALFAIQQMQRLNAMYVTVELPNVSNLFNNTKFKCAQS